ncbi:hypothetical protein HMPREF9336_04192 [Segniliparus rugosus ATCC BAA-974]|uniref:Uncharacterized protein n=1 Tax=Segniliparus rugosus (strain ATCC BAA-974 / DSM 45345 / CCUG 50838 / CIP 108380 / JCM 13579 / CDC 945) TaxID=679197 RepID=U1LMX4_SEGRC|nr:hypothetical protein HMPREF9336_04192 [Segniliparus rugosus ATCC BAA-974]
MYHTVVSLRNGQVLEVTGDKPLIDICENLLSITDSDGDTYSFYWPNVSFYFTARGDDDE